MAVEWKSIDGWPYEVSNQGEVRNSKKFILKTQPRTAGYRGVVLSRTQGGKCQRWTVSIHRLVAEAFLGPRPHGLQINHIDGIKTNNAASNLGYVTGAQNREHAARLGLMLTGAEISARMTPDKVYRGAQVFGVKLNEDKVKEIRRLFAEGKSLSALGRQFGVRYQTIQELVNRQTWRHVE